MSNDQSRTQFESWYQQRFGHSLYLEWNDLGFYESPATGNLFAAFGARPAVQVSSDYAELQRLAEAFPSDLDWDGNTEPFFNGPSGESLGGGATGFYTVYGKPFRIEGEDYDYDGPTYVEACNVDFAKFMVAARDGVLALLADLDEARNGMKVQAALRLKKEIERLDSTKSALVKERQAHNAQRDQLKVEVEALRKDAERYRWLAAHSFDVQGSTQFHIWQHTWEPHSQTGEPTEWKSRVRGAALARFIDAAMSKETTPCQK